MTEYVEAHVEALARIVHGDRRGFVTKAFSGDEYEVGEEEDYPLSGNILVAKLPEEVLLLWEERIRTWDGSSEETREMFRDVARSIIDALRDQGVEL